MKRMVTVVFVLGVSAFLLFAGGQNQSREGGEKHLSLWLPPYGTQDVLDQEMWEPVLKEFEAANAVDIELQITPWDNYEEKYMTGIAANEGPDVGYMYAEIIGTFIDLGSIKPISPYLTQADRQNYLYLDNGFAYGDQFGLPIIVGNGAVLFYNKDMLADLGFGSPPATWEEFLEMAIAATKDTNGDGKIDQWGFAPGWGATDWGEMNYLWYPWLWQAGGSLFSEDGSEVAFDGPEGMEAARFLYELKFTHKVIPPDAVSQKSMEMFVNYFAAGKALFTLYQSVAADKVLKKDYPDLNWGYVTSLKNRDYGTFVAADQLVLMSKAKSPELAFALMRHLTSGPSMQNFHKYNPWPPIAKDEPYSGSEIFRKMYAQDSSKLRGLKPVVNSNKVYDVLFRELQTMMLGERTAEEAVQNAAKMGNSYLND